LSFESGRVEVWKGELTFSDLNRVEQETWKKKVKKGREEERKEKRRKGERENIKKYQIEDHICASSTLDKAEAALPTFGLRTLVIGMRLPKEWITASRLVFLPFLGMDKENERTSKDGKIDLAFKRRNPSQRTSNTMVTKSSKVAPLFHHLSTSLQGLDWRWIKKSF